MVTMDIREGSHVCEEPLYLNIPDGLTRDMAEEAANILAALQEANRGLRFVASVSD